MSSNPDRFTHCTDGRAILLHEERSCTACGARIVFGDAQATETCVFCGSRLVRAGFADETQLPNTFIKNLRPTGFPSMWQKSFHLSINFVKLYYVIGLSNSRVKTV